MNTEFKKYFSLDKSFENYKINNDVGNTRIVNKLKILSFFIFGAAGFIAFRSIILLFSNKSESFQKLKLNLQLIKKKCNLNYTLLFQIRKDKQSNNTNKTEYTNDIIIKNCLDDYYLLLLEYSTNSNCNLLDKVLKSCLYLNKKISLIKYHHQYINNNMNGIQNNTLKILLNSEQFYDNNKQEKGIFITYAIKIMDSLVNTNEINVNEFSQENITITLELINRIIRSVYFKMLSVDNFEYYYMIKSIVKKLRLQIKEDSINDLSNEIIKKLSDIENTIPDILKTV